MNLYLLRHGLATEPAVRGLAKDSERPLTPKGKRKLLKAAKGIAAMELSFDVILSSPYARARETAEIVAKVLKAQRRLEFSDELAPTGNPRKLIELLKRFESGADEVLVVGHEPYLSQLTGLLAAGNTALNVAIKKGGLCKLSTTSLQPGPCATLQWLLTQKHLGLIA